MPRVGLRIPPHVLSQLYERAEEQEARDTLWLQALGGYMERKNNAPGSKLPSIDDRIRRDAFEGMKMPRTVVEVPDALFKRADKLAKRLHKSRELMYAEAMAEFLQGDKPPPSDWHP